MINMEELIALKDPAAAGWNKTRTAKDFGANIKYRRVWTNQGRIHKCGPEMVIDAYWFADDVFLFYCQLSYHAVIEKDKGHSVLHALGNRNYPEKFECSYYFAIIGGVLGMFLALLRACPGENLKLIPVQENRF